MNKRSNWLIYFFYALPALPLAALTLPTVIYLPKYYGEDLGLSLGAVGLILLLARLWDVISDPIIGYLSDRYTLFNTHRRGWVYLGLIPTLLGTYFLFLPPIDVSLTYMALWSIVLYTGWTLMIIPLNAWGAEISDDYNQRSSISAWREGFTVLGLLIVLSIIAFYGVNNAATAMYIIAAFLLIGLPISVLLLNKVPDTITQTHPIKWKQGLKNLTSNKPFLRLALSYLINGMANALPAVLFLFFVEHILKRPELSGPLLFLYFLCGILAVPVWVFLASKFSKHRIWCYAMIMACIAFLMIPFYGDHLSVFIAMTIITGFALGADLTLPASMQADVVDQDRLTSGNRPTGIYFAAWSMITKLSLALAYAVFPVMIFLGLDFEKQEKLWLVIIFYAVVPIIIKIFAIAVMWDFPLNRENTEELQLKIKQKWT